MDLVEIVNSLNEINKLSFEIIKQRNESRRQLDAISDYFKSLLPLTRKKAVFYSYELSWFVCLGRTDIYLLVSPGEVPRRRISPMDLARVLKYDRHRLLNVVDYHKDIVEEVTEHVFEYEFLENVVAARHVHAPVQVVEKKLCLNDAYDVKRDEVTVISAKADGFGVTLTYELRSRYFESSISLPVYNDVADALTVYSLKEYVIPVLEDLYSEREKVLKENEKIVKKVKESVSPVLVRKKLEQS